MVRGFRRGAGSLRDAGGGDRAEDDDPDDGVETGRSPVDCKKICKRKLHQGSSSFQCPASRMSNRLTNLDIHMQEGGI